MFIQRLRVEGLLSFRSLDVALEPLNVMIGANGSGKSNLIEVMGLLQAAPGVGMAARMRQSGGVASWFHRNGSRAALSAELVSSGRRVTYAAELARADAALEIVSERLGARRGDRTGLLRDQSILQVERRPETSAGIYGRLLERMGIYRYFQVDPRSMIRAGGDTGADPAVLSESGENLAMVIHNLDVEGRLGPVNEQLARIGVGFEAIKARIVGTRAFLELVEGDLRVSSARISDGTLRFLCMMTVLLQTGPPSLVCLEEPELGLHPDAIRVVAEAIADASERMQVVITTHSPDLVTGLQHRPGSFLICDKVDGATVMERPGAKRLNSWLTDYSLGEVWKSGELGGVRW